MIYIRFNAVKTNKLCFNWHLGIESWWERGFDADTSNALCKKISLHSAPIPTLICKDFHSQKTLFENFIFCQYFACICFQKFNFKRDSHENSTCYKLKSVELQAFDWNIIRAFLTFFHFSTTFSLKFEMKSGIWFESLNNFTLFQHKSCNIQAHFVHSSCMQALSHQLDSDCDVQYSFLSNFLNFL